MKNTSRSDRVSLERRMQLLTGIPGFGMLPPKLLKELAAGVREEHFPLGAVIVAEGEMGDRLFVIEDGEAEVTTAGATGAVSLAVLGTGDLFGEIALLEPNRQRQATVTARTEVSTVSLSAAAFDTALAQCPDMRPSLDATADTLLTAKFLRQQGSWRL